MSNFSDLGLAPPLLRALATEGYTTPTPIQTKAIPVVMTGADLLGIAQTGTGKTAAFALPILHRLMLSPRPAPRKGCRVLVLSPTRELATQIAQSFRTYGRGTRLSVAVIFGGVGYRPQIAALAAGVDVLVAAPGRLLDLMGERHAVFSSTEVLVLDEADQMLDLGFFKPIRCIVSQLPVRRQNLFFSATMPAEIGRLADEILVDPVKVAVAPQATTVERVGQRVIHTPHASKRAVLVELLSDAAMARTIVFTRTKRGADRVAKHLLDHGIGAAAIHGNKSQNQRERALEDFRQARTRVLVATDIAARGIDIEQVSHVVNFDLPEVPEAYVHRIGRTARAGAEGRAISLCDPNERGLLRDIERLTRQTISAESRMGPLPDRPQGSGETPRPAGGTMRRAGSEREARSRGTRTGGQRSDGSRPRGEAYGEGRGHGGPHLPRRGGVRPAQHARPEAQGRGYRD